MKKLGIDARLISQTGVGAYIRSLLKYLQPLVSKNIEVYIFVRSEEEDLVRQHFPNAHIVHANFLWHSLSEQTLFLHLLNSYKLDLMHFTYFSYPIGYVKPFLITIHDLTPLMLATGKASTKHPFIYYAKHMAYRFLLRRAVVKSSAIITPTIEVKNSIREYFGNEYTHKIYVTYEGLHEKLLNAKPDRNMKNQIPPQFFLYVGNFYPHKNVETLIRAFSEVRTDASLILVGPDDFFSSRIQKLIDSLQLNKRVRLYHHITDDQLAYLYSNAEALIHPSLAEGFGLPLLEASYFSCPIIASRIPVFEEVLGDSFLSFDPQDQYSIASTIQHFIEKPHKKFLSPAVLQKKFSFKVMAEKTYDIYKNLLGGK